MVKVQKPAPSFKGWAAIDGEVKEISLEDYKGHEAAAKFRAIKCELIGCSVDSVYCHLKFVSTDKAKGGLGGCNIPLLGDLSRDICKAYDVLIEEEGEDKGIALRGLFIIDGRGILRAGMTSDLQVGRNPEEILRMVQAFQFTDTNPADVCPASWTPGARTLKGAGDASEYFAAA